MEVPLGDTFYFKFTTRQYSDGAPATLSGTPEVAIYEENNTTEITGAETLTVDYDTRTGLNDVAVVCTGANGFEAGKYYQAVIIAGTVGGTSVVGECVGPCFRIVPAEDAGAGIRDVNVTHFGDTAATTAAGRPEVNTTHVGGTSQTANDMSGDVNTILTRVGANNLNTTASGNIGIDWANVENPTSIVNLSATNIDVDQVVASVSGAVGSVTGAVGSVTGAVGSVTAAVTVDTINANVITASAVATDAADEIAAAVWDEDATGHQTLGTFGQAIGDPAANTKTLYAALVTDAVGASVTADVATAQADLDTITGSDGVTLATAQALYAPSKAGDAMDLVANAVDTTSLSTSGVDKFWDEAMTETTGAPAVTGTFRDAVKWMFALSRNKVTQTATTTTLRNDADSADLATSTVSDDSTTYTRGEWSV